MIKHIKKISQADVTVKAPPSKAHTLRALVLGSLADGITVIRQPLLGEDQLHLIQCLKDLGVAIETGKDFVAVQGVKGRYLPKTGQLDVGESGVCMNFLTAAACLAKDPMVISGASRLQERPIGDLVDGLNQLGCRIEYLNKEGYPPIRVKSSSIPGGQAAIHGEKTSQYFSAIAIVAPYAEKEVTIKCLDLMSERPYLDITLDMISAFGNIPANTNYREIKIPAGKIYTARDITIEGDYSNSAYFFLAAAICKSIVSITGLNPDSKQGDKKLLVLLEKMGCIVTQDQNKVMIKGVELRAIEEDMRDIPDIVPPIAIASGFASGTSRFTGIGHLRHKESDRPAVLVSELMKMGVNARCGDDWLEIEGSKHIHGATIDPHNDHRIAMSFAVAGLATGDQIIQNPECVGKSWPDFWKKLECFC